MLHPFGLFHTLPHYYRYMNLSLALQQSHIIKGVAIILLMIHHYSGMGYAASELEIFQGLGPVICGAFFFCSGYGIALGGNQRDWRYWSIRFTKILIPFILANTLYIIYWYFFRKYNLSFIHVLGDLTGITLVNGHCWFLQALILLYISYAIVSRKSCAYLVISSVILGTAYTLVTNNLASLSWLGFPLGILCARYKLQTPRWSLMIFLAIFVITFYLHQYYFGRRIVSSEPVLNLIVMVVSSLPLWIALVKIPGVFVGKLIFLTTHFSSLISKTIAVLTYMGKRSMDFYMMHGMSLLILSKMKTHSQLQLIPVYILSIIILSLLFHYLTKAILSRPINRMQRNTALIDTRA